jgi:hypothetical protein
MDIVRNRGSKGMDRCPLTLITSHGASGVELADRSSMLHFCPVAQITGLDIDANVAGYLGPPVVAGYKL